MASEPGIPRVLLTNENQYPHAAMKAVDDSEITSLIRQWEEFTATLVHYAENPLAVGKWVATTSMETNARDRIVTINARLCVAAHERGIPSGPLDAVAGGRVSRETLAQARVVIEKLRIAPPTTVENDRSEDTAYVLHPDDEKILKALANAKTTQRLFQLEASTELSRKTLSKRLAELRNAKLVHRPKGERGGEAITEAGTKRLAL